jgi:hypothetical protein
MSRWGARRHESGSASFGIILPNLGVLPPAEYDKEYTGTLTITRGHKYIMENGCELNVQLANPLAEAIRKPQERGADALPHRPRVKQKWDRNAASRHTALPKPVLLKPGGLAAPPVARRRAS